MNTKKLNNQIVFITGASRGIGAAIADRFAEEGADVIFTYVNSVHQATEQEKKLVAKGVRSKAIRVNSADANALREAIELSIADFGPIDILVNNAGIFPSGNFGDHTISDYEEVMDINVKAVFAASQAVLASMPDGGRIISIGSNLADLSVTGDTVLYSMSKAALQGFTRGLARSAGQRKITVNLVQPGPVDTDMNPATAPHADFLRSRMALSDYGTGEDIAGLVAFLASNEGKYITGSVLTIDGGMNA